MEKTSTKNITAAIIVGDFLMGFFGLVIGYWVRFHSDSYLRIESWWPGISVDNSQPFRKYFGLIVFGATLLSGTYLTSGLYDSKNLLRYRVSVLMMARAIGLWLVLYLSLSLVLKFDPPISRLYGIGSALFAFIRALFET